MKRMLTVLILRRRARRVAAGVTDRRAGVPIRREDQQPRLRWY
jgi:hypothetical protein